jgi:hypothetical protein
VHGDGRSSHEFGDNEETVADLRQKLAAERALHQQELLRLQAQLEGVRGRSGREPTIDMKLFAWEEHISAVRARYKDGAKPLNKTINRFNGIVDEVLAKIGRMTSTNLLRPLRINFKGEGAVDDGACSREMFSQFFERLFCRTSEYFAALCNPGGCARRAQFALFLRPAGSQGTE